MTDEERIAVAVVSARLVGVHPDWIEWAKPRTDGVPILQYMTKVTENGARTYVRRMFASMSILETDR